MSGQRTGTQELHLGDLRASRLVHLDGDLGMMHIVLHGR